MLAGLMLDAIFEMRGIRYVICGMHYYSHDVEGRVND